MRQRIIAGIPCSLVLIGCAHVKPTVPEAAPSEPERAVSQGVGATPDSTVPSGTPPPAATGPASAEPGNGSKTTAQSAAHGSSRPKPKPSTLKSPGNAPAAAVGSSAAAAAAKPSAAPASDTSTRQSTPSAPALDLRALEQRLKETQAIGLFTKLSLKNQVDDLLNQFRAFHGNQGATTLAELRQRYDLLLLKVLSLLQDGDPALAAAISSSREALWGILADPVKFRQTVI